ncbi:kinase-like protein, partial [Calocera cornea HHB12733]
EIAAGLDHLHTRTPRRIIHGDVKGVSILKIQTNVLIDANGVPKISDFGLSHFIDLLSVESWDTPWSAIAGTAGWMALERVAPSNFGLRMLEAWVPAADSFSYGMLIYEVCTSHVRYSEEQLKRGFLTFQVLALQVPFQGLKPFEKSLKILKGERRELPLQAKSAIAENVELEKSMEIMRLCWSQAREDRKSMQRVLQLLPGRPELGSALEEWLGGLRASLPVCKPRASSYPQQTALAIASRLVSSFIGYTVYR